MARLSAVVDEEYYNKVCSFCSSKGITHKELILKGIDYQMDNPDTKLINDDQLKKMINAAYVNLDFIKKDIFIWSNHNHEEVRPRMINQINEIRSTLWQIVKQEK